MFGRVLVAVPQAVAHAGVQVDPEQHLKSVAVLGMLHQDVLVDVSTVFKRKVITWHYQWKVLRAVPSCGKFVQRFYKHYLEIPVSNLGIG